jgi:hypothetical protein
MRYRVWRLDITTKSLNARSLAGGRLRSVWIGRLIGM